MKKWLFMSVILLFSTACDPDALPPELQELIARNGQPWRVESITVGGGAINESAFATVRYTFTINENGNTYVATIPPNSILSSRGFKPNYFSQTDQGTWEIGAGRVLIFDKEDFLISSEVNIIGEPQVDRIELEWLVPEFFDKIAPVCQMVLVPE